MSVRVGTNSPRFTAMAGLTVIAAFFIWGLSLTIGLPQVSAAASFFSAFPSPSSANALVNCLLWLTFAGLALYGISSVVGMTHRSWAVRRREHLAELALGGLGFALLCIGLVHGGGGAVHPGAISQALQLVKAGS